MNLTPVFFIVLLVFLLAILFYWEYYIKRKFHKITLQKYKVMGEVIRKLEANENVSDSDLLIIAKDPSLRYALYKTLQMYDKADLFPSEYLTTEKAAESILVNWLEFPTELGKPPDEIHFIKKVTIVGPECLDYYVFKFRVRGPHRMASLKWIVGVCGPFAKEALPYDNPIKAYSRFKPVAEVTPEGEVTWVHKHIG